MQTLVLENLYKIYKEAEIETVALREVQLTVNAGEFVAIRGRSGAGKTTLLNLIGGLDTPNAGRVVIDGTDIARLNETERATFRRKHIGIVFQTDNLVPFLSALENVQLPMQFAGRNDTRTRAQDLLAQVGLAARVNHKSAQLSGGERQRVAIAVALANEPSLLLADELTGELDSTTAEQVMELLGTLNDERKLTLVIVTHNKTVAARARRQVKIDNGQLTASEVSDV